MYVSIMLVTEAADKMMVAAPAAAVAMVTIGCGIIMMNESMSRCVAG